MPRSRQIVIIALILSVCLFMNEDAQGYPSAHPYKIYETAKIELARVNNPYRHQTAKRLLQHLIKQFPASPFGYLGMSEVYYEESDLGNGYHRMDVIRTQALPLAIKALERGSSLRMVHEHYDRFMDVFQKVQTVQNQLEKDLKEHPYDLSTMKRMGLYLLIQGDLRKAWDYILTGWDEKINLNGFPFNTPQLMDALMQEGLKTSHEQSAILRSLQGSPQNETRLLWMGRIFEHFNDYKKAESLFEAYLKEKPQDTYAQYYYTKSRAYRFLKNGVSREVWALFHSLIHNPYATREDLRLFARLSFALGRIEDAYQAYVQVEKMTDGYDPDLIFWLGRCMQLLGRPHVAQTYFNHLNRVFHDSEQAMWLKTFKHGQQVHHSSER